MCIISGRTGTLMQGKTPLRNEKQTIREASDGDDEVRGRELSDRTHQSLRGHLVRLSEKDGWVFSSIHIVTAGGYIVRRARSLPAARRLSRILAELSTGPYSFVSCSTRHGRDACGLLTSCH